jgi:hypothetical protein
MAKNRVSGSCGMSFRMLAGSATRSAERARRSMFFRGLNKRALPSGPKYAWFEELG